MHPASDRPGGPDLQPGLLERIPYCGVLQRLSGLDLAAARKGYSGFPSRRRPTSMPRARVTTATATAGRALLPGTPSAAGARNGSQRVQTAPDSARPTQNVCASGKLSVRLSPTVADTLKFPDTEEVTGSNPVRPTPFFEILSTA